MTRGEGSQTKIHLKGKQDDFLVFVDDVDTYKKWLSDSSIPMAHFISTFKVFLTHKQGVQGQLDEASKSTLASQFDTEDEDKAIQIILREGSMQTTETSGRQGSKNDSMSSMNTH